MAQEMEFYSTWLSGTIPNSNYAVVQLDHNVTVDNDYTIESLPTMPP
jgi:hypothetical protein